MELKELKEKEQFIKVQENLELLNEAFKDNNTRRIVIATFRIEDIIGQMKQRKRQYKPYNYLMEQAQDTITEYEHLLNKYEPDRLQKWKNIVNNEL